MTVKFHFHGDFTSVSPALIAFSMIQYFVLVSYDYCMASPYLNF